MIDAHPHPVPVAVLGATALSVLAQSAVDPGWEKLANLGATGAMLVIILWWYAKRERASDEVTAARLKREQEWQAQLVTLIENGHTASDRCADAICENREAMDRNTVVLRGVETAVKQLTTKV